MITIALRHPQYKVVVTCSAGLLRMREFRWLKLESGIKTKSGDPASGQPSVWYIRVYILQFPGFTTEGKVVVP